MKPHVFPPQRMLVATDMSRTSAAALAFARRLREQFGGAIHVMYAHYFELPAYFSSGQFQALARELANLRNEAAKELRKMSHEALGESPEVLVVERPPVQAILETSESLQGDLVIVGTHGRRGTERVWLGSVAEQVLRLSRRPVLSVRPDSRVDRIRHILCPVASTESSFVALDYAAQMATATGATLHALHAAEPGVKPMERPIVDETIRNRCTVEETIMRGDAAGVILRHASTNTPDVMVLGAEHKSSAFAHMFSSTTQKVMQSSPVPIFVIPKWE
jgi:nucleotide-binding universal stress UspA family protein